MSRSFLDLLYEESSRDEFDDLVAAARREGVTGDALDELRRQGDLALRLRETIARQRAREAELTALYDTANDLTAIRDVDTILAAIVRRARQLLNADMAYLSLNDEDDGASYMRVTDGALTQEFRTLRLPLGTGLLGLVAQTGAPYFTEDYRCDPRFVHRGYIDDAVEGEGIRAILGVPLAPEGRVIGTLLAVHRTVRPFPPAEVSLLTSFAAHAAVALENARLFAELDEANRAVSAHALAIEQAAVAHDRLTDLLLQTAGVEDVAAVMAEVLGGRVAIHDPANELLAGEPSGCAWRSAVAATVSSGHSVEAGGTYVAAALAGTEHVATLVAHGLGRPLDQAEQRTLERGALVTALVLLFARTVAQTEERLGGELLVDLIEAPVLDGPLRERARRHGLSLDPPLAAVVASVQGVDRHAAVRVATQLAQGGLAGEHRGALVLLVPSADPLAVGLRLRDRVRAIGGDATVGAAPAVADLATTYAEARRCLDALVALGRSGDVSDPAGLGVTRLLIGERGPKALEEYVDSLLGPVLEYDARRGTELVATLEEWFATGGHLRRTGERLHVHPNTVLQRLQRVAELLGPDWRAPARSLDLQLALRVHRLQPLTQPGDT